MITAHFDIHELLYSIEGFARGSHLRQHIWNKVFKEYLPQLSDDEQDYLWFFMRRDLWECYFDKYGSSCGSEDFLRCMAALHRGNRALVTTKYKGKKSQFMCYRFNNHWCPFNQSFTSYVAEEYIVVVSPVEIPDNRYLQIGYEEMWNDLDVYNRPTSEIRWNLEKN